MCETFSLTVHKFLLGFACSEEGKPQYLLVPSSKLFPADADAATTDTLHPNTKEVCDGLHVCT
jgi:hypothetical protein